jgi:two-component system nitrogen regulation response regulator GlnG
MTAIRASERGAYEYLPKPFDLKELIAIVGRALSEPRTRPAEVDSEEPGDNIPLVGRSPAMQDIYRVLARLMQTDLTVMISGESGTGKELVARALHDYGKRHNGPFVPINMAAIPRDLIEAELFGHEKGAFTGAQARSAGRFEQADGGTLFLDEIGDMSLPLQTRLLRVLAEGEFYRVGGQTPIRVDVRVIAATHQNLEERVARGQFREDLFHRLNVIRIELPPLRLRREDVPMLLTHYMGLAAKELGTDNKTLSTDAAEVLARYGWPGNVRELVNLCRRLTVLAPGSEVHIDDLPPEITSAGPAATPADDWVSGLAGWADKAAVSGGRPLLDEALPQFEQTLIRVALKHTQGHRQAAAKLLGWGRNTLTRKLKELGMDDIPE